MNKLVEKKTGDYHQTPAEFDKWFISFDDDDEMFVFIDTDIVFLIKTSYYTPSGPLTR